VLTTIHDILQGHWLMYWIVYALFSVAETFTDTLVFWYLTGHVVNVIIPVMAGFHSTMK